MKFSKLKNPHELMGFLEENIKYGFVSEDGKVFEDSETFTDNLDKYRLRLGEDLIDAGYGVCWDQVELARLFFEQQNLEHSCYLLRSPKSGIAHACLLYKDGDKQTYNLFDNAIGSFSGIHEYATEQQALEKITGKVFQKQIAQMEIAQIFGRKYEKPKALLYKYSKVENPLNHIEFLRHCHKGQKTTMLLQD